VSHRKKFRRDPRLVIADLTIAAAVMVVAFLAVLVFAAMIFDIRGF
jgi:hypothetical protein